MTAEHGGTDNRPGHADAGAPLRSRARSRQRHERRRSRPLLWAVLLATIPSGITLWGGHYITDVDLRKIVFAGATTLFFGGFLGGVLKLLLDEVLVSKRRRDDATSFVTNVLADLKGVYDRVARARIVIAAHRSVKTYGDEMRAMIDARVQLRNVTRALDRRSDGITHDARTEVVRRVEQMEAYLETLNSEFIANYKRLSDRQRSYEERAKVVLKHFAEDDSGTEPPELPGFVWESVSALPELAAFIEARAAYKKNFEEPLDDASECLRDELARIVRTASSAV